MASSVNTDIHGESSEPLWLSESVQLLRTNGYITTFVRIGYELVLIVSGPSGEAAVVDLSHGSLRLWKDAWAGLRVVLPGMPVVCVIPAGEFEDLDQNEVPVIALPEPAKAEQVAQAIEEVLQPRGRGF
jgi:hypothetical protein